MKHSSNPSSQDINNLKATNRFSSLSCPTYIALGFYAICLLALSCKSNSTMAQITHGENHLANESSPYLLQHAKNPVDWYPWGQEALDKAKNENKMIIISIGYAACHWCHVMEHESFEDTTVSRIMNEHFVAIKIDREERPDIDDVYMTACHLATENNCGWPLNAFAMPDGRPVWAGTYFPKKNWLEILTYFEKEFQKAPEKMEEYATQLTAGIQSSGKVNPAASDEVFTKDILETIGRNFLKNIDYKEGGRKGAPKFPMPNNYEFLLSYYHYSGDEKALEAVTTSLDKMAFGGIYDQLGGGFARYSTDAVWLVPHFEKMLYDNAQLISLYSEAYKLTQKPLYKEIVEESLTYVQREMTSPEGGFYSSLDADSDGEEGKFYVWNKGEIDSLLTDEMTNKVFCDYYEISKRGNWEHGKNILHRKKSKAQIAKKHQLTIEKLDQLISHSKATLFAARAPRIRPGLDDKVLTAWNALMLKGYVDAYEAFGEPAYLDIALRNANFLVKNAIKEDHRLNRNYKDGKSVINAFLDDYALLADAFVALYQVTFDEQWLKHADGLLQHVITNFHDESSNMFWYTSKLDPPLIARKMETADNVIPGSNSSMARALFKVGTFLYNPSYIDYAKTMLQNMNQGLSEQAQPNFYSNWCSLYLDFIRPPYEVAIVGQDFQKKQQALMAKFLPNVLLLGGADEGQLQLLKDKLQEGATMIYVCQNKVCKLPVEEVEKALPLMK